MQPESHYTICSPLATLPWEEELQFKQTFAARLWSDAQSGSLEPEDIPIIGDATQQYGYRNKMEFSFVELPGPSAEPADNTISLAFFERGTKRRVPIDGCALAEPVINTVARAILVWVNEVKIPMRSLKSLIIRSNGAGQAIAALFIKDELPFSHFPKVTKQLLGFTLYYSTHKSPASVPTKLLHHEGQDFLSVDILGTVLTFGLLSFFQINIPIFTQALRKIGEHIEQGSPIVDYYSGVGAISLPLADRYQSADLVENNEEAVRFSQENMRANGISNAQAYCMPSEKMRELITADKTIIFDPPRSGLHPKISKQILEQKPVRIIYLSCNLETQVRDVQAFNDAYQVSAFSLFNFFPRTPHVEGLMVLDRR